MQKLTRILKISGILLLSLAILLAVAYPFRRDPIAMLAGKELTGEEKAYPASWEFSRQYQLIAVESRPEDPHSVTTVSLLIDGELHIPAMRAPTKEWPGIVRKDPRVRIKIGDHIYPAQLTLVSDNAGVEYARQFQEKFEEMGREPPAERPADVWLFKVSPR